MLASHCRFLAVVDPAGPMLRKFVTAAGSGDLIEQFDSCVGARGGFRTTHRSQGPLELRSRPVGVVEQTSTGLAIPIGDDASTTFDRSMTGRIVPSATGVWRSRGWLRSQVAGDRIRAA